LEVSALSIGRTGELIASAALELLGHQATAVADRKYDLLVDCGSKFIRVQVKASFSTEARGPNYQFKTAHGRHSKKTYVDGQVDIFALVAVDERRCVFLPQCDITTVTIRLPKTRFTDREEEARSWRSAMEVF